MTKIYVKNIENLGVNKFTINIFLRTLGYTKCLKSYRLVIAHLLFNSQVGEEIVYMKSKGEFLIKRRKFENWNLKNRPKLQLLFFSSMYQNFWSIILPTTAWELSILVHSIVLTGLLWFWRVYFYESLPADIRFLPALKKASYPRK